LWREEDTLLTGGPTAVAEIERLDNVAALRNVVHAQVVVVGSCVYRQIEANIKRCRGIVSV